MKFIHKYFVHFCLFLIGISLIFRFIYLEDSAMLYFHTISALGNFGVGGLLAHGVFAKSEFLEGIKNWPKSRNILVYILMFLSLAFYHQLMKIEVFVVLGRLIYSLFFAFFILEQSQGVNRWFNCDRLPIFNYFGKISYGLYCFHGVVITLFLQAIPFVFPEQSLILVFALFPPIIFVSTILLSHLSYRFFERYFLTLKQKFYTFNP